MKMDLVESAKEKEPHAVRDKILACLYAGALGDALGYAVEFERWESIQRHYGKAGIRALRLHDGKAVFSDDTQMTLFTAEGMLLGFWRAYYRGIGAPVEDYIYQSYLCWYHTQGCEAKSAWEDVSELLQIPQLQHRRAPGNTCLGALSSGKQGRIDAPLNHSKGCGGVMRVAPLGFLRAKRDGQPVFGKAVETGAKTAVITHGDPLGWLPAGMLADMIDRCLYGNYTHLEDIVSDALTALYEAFGTYSEFSDFEARIRRAVTLAKENTARQSGVEEDEAAIRSLGEGWVGDEALAIAVYAVLRRSDDLKECLCTAVNHSGDSDSTGAIAGNILGAFLGLSAVPQDWIDQLELADTMAELADKMQHIIETA